MSAGGDIGDDDRALAGEYALGLLEPDAARAFEARLAAEPDLRAAYAEWAESFAELADPLDAPAPPATVWAGIESRLFAQTPARRSLLARYGWLLGAGVAAVLALLVLLPDLIAPTAPPMSAQLASADGSMRVNATYDPRAGALTLIREAGEGPPPDRSEELWLIAAPEGSAAISLGLLPAAGTITVAVPEPLRPALAGATLAITDEPAGGAPGGVATGPILAAGLITAS